MDLKPRLAKIIDLIDRDYSEVWDTCCDHGQLGIELIKHPQIGKVHFVDRVDSIMDTLDTKIKEIRLLDPTPYQLHKQEAQDICLAKQPSLICICGVGGITAIEILKGIQKNNNIDKHDIALCVVHHNYQLREYLIHEDFKVKSEHLIFEGKWGHEIMLVGKQDGKKIDPVGGSIFDLQNTQHLYHLQKTIKHYKNKSQSTSWAKKVYTQYLSLLD